MNKPVNVFPQFGKQKNNKESKPLVFENPWLMVRHWYASDLGQAFLATEKYSLDKLLEQIFGYNLVQLGCLDGSNKDMGLISNSRTSEQYIFESMADIKQLNLTTQAVSEFENLAIQNHSLDAVILPHTLEFEQNPHQILREVERILVAEGKAVFLGFNPYSIWGLWHKYWELKVKWQANKTDEIVLAGQVPLPSCGHLISQRRLSDWLQLLGFDIDLQSEYFFRPPIRSSVLLKKLEFMELAGQFSKILPAGAYLLVATKRVSTLTPIRQGWKLPKRILTPKTVETADLKSSQTPQRRDKP